MKLHYCSTDGCPNRWKNFKPAKCPKCHREATALRKLPPGFKPFVIGDIPEHYTQHLGCVVKSRKHLKEIQLKHGLQDYEPVREGPQTSHYRRMRRNGMAL